MSTTWKKLDVTKKLGCLMEYAERQNKETSMPIKMVQKLKHFLRKCLEENQLSGLKDVVYDPEKRKVISIPGLVVHIPEPPERGSVLPERERSEPLLFTLIPSEKTPTNDRSLTPRHLLEKSKRSASKHAAQKPCANEEVQEEVHAAVLSEVSTVDAKEPDFIEKA